MKELAMARNAWRDIYALGSLSDAERTLQQIEKAASEGNDSVKWPLWIAFIVTYSKPFTSNNGMGSISTKLIPPELKELHTAFTQARNLLYAHTDADETLNDGLPANQLIATKVGNSIEIVPHTLTPQDEEIPRAKQLIAGLLEQLRGSTENGIAEIKAKVASQPDGQYSIPFPSKPSK